MAKVKGVRTPQAMRELFCRVRDNPESVGGLFNAVIALIYERYSEVEIEALLEDEGCEPEVISDESGERWLFFNADKSRELTINGRHHIQLYSPATVRW